MVWVTGLGGVAGVVLLIAHVRDIVRVNTSLIMGGELEFTETVDPSVRQDVPIPPVPATATANQTNSVLSNMIKNAEEQRNPRPPVGGGASQPPPSASYQPRALPAALQFSQSSHPTACLFHVLFKGLAVATYIIGPKFGSEPLMVTVICLLLNAADFWTVKNVTGRLLVSLRFWNKVNLQTGETEWVFESAAGRQTNKFDSRFFWTVLYVTPLVWGVLFLSAILWLKFNCLVTLAVALVLSGSNVAGYYKCSSDQRQKMNELLNKGMASGMSMAFRNGMLGRFFGGGRTQVPQTEMPPSDGTFA